MSNVNIWGPQAWSVLHGLCGLCTLSLTNGLPINIEDYSALAKIFDLLRILLPCPLCLDSYKIFYNDLEASLNHSIFEEIRNGGAFTLCYNLHNLVNEKLFRQRRGDVYLGKPIESKKLNALYDSYKRVQNTPTLLVVEKRFKATDLHPFSEEAVWTMLASFCVHIDKEKTESLKRERINAIHEFCGVLSPLLQLGVEYDDLASRIQILDSLFLAFNPPDTSRALDLLCYAKYEVTTIEKDKKDVLSDIYSTLSDTWKERQVIKNSYLEALTVKSCSNTCS
jgi:hypothetical protein